MRRVDETPVADVDADVPETVEEDEVARPERGPADAAATVELRIARVSEGEAEMCIDVADEAGAVEAGPRRAPAVLVADTAELPRVVHDPRAEGEVRLDRPRPLP